MASAGSLRTPFEAALVGRLLPHPPTPRPLPVGALTRQQKLAELRRVQARKAMDAGYEAELVLGLADDTPTSSTRRRTGPVPRGGRGRRTPSCPGSPFFTSELAVVLNCGRRTATHLARRAWVYRENLPATWAALAAGALDEARAKVLADVLGLTSAALARQVEARLLPEATRLPTGRLRARALALLLELDADAVDARRKTAEKQADVRSDPAQLEGMTTLAAELPTPVAAEADDLINQLAAMLEVDGDPRPIGALRAAVLAA